MSYHPTYPMPYPMMQGQGQAAGQQGQAQGGQYQAQQAPMGAGYPSGYPSGHPGAGYPAGAWYPGMQPVMPVMQQSQSQPFLNFSNDRFLKGLLIGAAAAYLLTNESVQRTAIKGAVKLWTSVQGGVEEVKERFRDAEAELQAADISKD